MINLALRMEKYGFETVVATGTAERGEEDLADELAAAPQRVERIPGLRRDVSPLLDLWALRGLKKLILEFKPDVIHTHTSKAGALGRMASTHLKPAPVRVHTYHGHVLDGYFGLFRSDFFRRMERTMARRTDALVAVSPSVRDELLARHQVGRPEQYRVIPSGFPELDLAGAESLRRELELGDRPVAGMIGRMVPVKGYDLFFKAVPRILEALPDMVFLLTGDGPLRPRVEAFAERPEVRGAVRVLGTRRDVERVLKTLDVLILPSRKEGLPTVLLEAAAAGVPVAASRIPGVLDLVTGEGDALLFDPASPEEMADAVLRLARDPELRRALAEAARRRVTAAVPDYETVAELHARLYHELMER